MAESKTLRSDRLPDSLPSKWRCENLTY